MTTRLFLETSNLDFQLALHDGDGFLYRSDHNETGSDIQLHTMLGRGLEKSDRQVSDIDEIVVDVGPGGLTSTRSGIAFANGLSFAKQIPIVEANSIELMVLESYLPENDWIIGARRSNEGKYFMAFYHAGKCQRLTLGKPEDLIAQEGWQDHAITWIGPKPPRWKDEPTGLDLTFVDLLSPSLDAFEKLVALPEFSTCARCRSAAPINEKIR